MRLAFARKRQRMLGLLLVLLLAALVSLRTELSEVQAATARFKTVKGKTYYIHEDGSRHRGWLVLNGKKYYFNKKTGVQLKGWQTNSKGERVRYFSKGKGIMATGFYKDKSGATRYFNPSTGKMVTGWMKDSSGHRYYFKKGTGVMLTGWATVSGKKRYFAKSTGRMYTGWWKDSKGRVRYFDKTSGYMSTGLKKVGGNYYYFSASGYRYQKGFKTIAKKKYYFDLTDGHAHTGWLSLSGKLYYFSQAGVMYRNTTAEIDGITYSFSSYGVATAKTETGTSSNALTISIYDEKNQRTYTVMRQYLTHNGVASGEKSDLDLLAALCESEAGDQGEIGMEAVALCVLNRTIKADKEFPSSVRYVIYQGTTFAQYSVVTNGALEKRLNGQFEDRTAAYSAASKALDIFNKYVTNGTKRKLSGFKTEDFNYMYFMMESYFWKQPLNFEKVKYEEYKDHIFFVDWVS